MLDARPSYLDAALDILKDYKVEPADWSAVTGYRLGGRGIASSFDRIVYLRETHGTFSAATVGTWTGADGLANIIKEAQEVSECLERLKSIGVPVQA